VGSEADLTDPDALAAAKALHAAGPLSWLQWTRLDPEVQAEYLARAELAD
jgi:hypothetical protein